MKNIISWFIIIALIITGVWFFWTQKTLAPAIDGTPLEKPPVVTDPSVGMIEVSSPTQGAQITSPLTVTGRARGNWYFEASFPIELKDSNDIVIATAVAQAQGDWMTVDFVPFSATITFPSQPAGSTGKLVLHKDNPSGEPQNAASLVIPIQF